MKAFMDEHFLLKNETAKRLYHQYAEHMPIIDYHCHLSAKDIWENRPAENITQIWLGDDHCGKTANRKRLFPVKAAIKSVLWHLPERCPMRREIRFSIGRIWSFSAISESERH